MTIGLNDRVKTACTSTGTGQLRVSSTPEVGYQNWDAVPDATVTYYCINWKDDWEVGYGVKLGRDIARNTLSSSTGETLNLDGTSCTVFCTYPAEKAIIRNEMDEIEFGNFTISDADDKLTFKVAGTKVFTVDASGNMIVKGNVTAYGTP